MSETATISKFSSGGVLLERGDQRAAQPIGEADDADADAVVGAEDARVAARGGATARPAAPVEATLRNVRRVEGALMDTSRHVVVAGNRYTLTRIAPDGTWTNWVTRHHECIVPSSFRFTGRYARSYGYVAASVSSMSTPSPGLSPGYIVPSWNE